MTNGHNNNKICPILSAYANNLYICEKERCAFYIKNNNNEGCAITLLAKELLTIENNIQKMENISTDISDIKNTLSNISTAINEIKEIYKKIKEKDNNNEEKKE